MQYDPAKTVELIKKFQGGDKEAFNGIYEDTYRLVYNACYGVLGNEDDAQDITQDTFIQIYKKLDTLQDPSAYAKWMKLTATRLAINHVTRSDKFETVEDDTVLDVYSNDWSEFDSLPDSFIEEEEQRQILDDILRKSLSEVQYQTLFMHFFDEMNIEQIADAMNCPSGTVKTRLMHAKAKIRKPLEKYFDPGKAVYAAVPFLTRFFTANAVKTGIPPIAVLGIPGVAGTAGLAGAEAGLGAGSPVIDTGVSAAADAGRTAVGKAAGAKGGLLSTVAGKITIGGLALLFIGTIVTVSLIIAGTDKSEESTSATVTTVTSETEVTVETSASSDETTASKANDVDLYSVVKFGNYAGEDISWIVIDENDDSVMLLSEKAIEKRELHDNDNGPTWATCSLRAWLNNEFFNSAFNDSEKNSILLSHYGLNTENDIEDYVYLLSLDEINKYFDSDASRKTKGTDHVLADINYGSDGNVAWWLRTPSDDRNYFAMIDYTGAIVDSGELVIDNVIGVRPVIWVRKSWFASTENSSTLSASETPVSDKDYVVLGHYEQDGDLSNGPEPVEWEVVKEETGRMLVVSRYILDCQQYYNASMAVVSWEFSDMRKWINGDFYNSAFSDTEKSRIVAVAIPNTNPYYGYGTKGKDTEDKLFCLSIQELLDNYGFADWDEERKTGSCQDLLTEVTPYAASKDRDGILYYHGDASMDSTRPLYGTWWLRDGHLGRTGTFTYNGEISEWGRETNEFVGVRPAMWVSK